VAPVTRTESGFDMGVSPGFEWTPYPWSNGRAAAKFLIFRWVMLGWLSI
jgi:hypothetical protein